MACALLAVAVVALSAPAGVVAQPTPAPPVVLDGPSAGIVAPAGLEMSVARDGTGGLIYLKNVAGVEHVFLSILAGGTFQAPAEMDSALVGPSSQPVVAAGNGGLLVVAFVNGGQLYVLQRISGRAGLSAPAALLAGAFNPSLEMTNFGKAYLAFTAADGSGDDVRTAYYYAGRWALEASPLNASPADNAGTGVGRPAVAAAGDGVAIVAWGEGGHVYTRRVWTVFPSVVLEQADAPLPGCSETAADEPAVAAGGDSSYADVAFHELLSCGAQQQSRVLANRLHGSRYDGVVQSDGLSTPATDGADDPQVVMAEYGQGWVTSSRNASHDVYAMALGGSGSPRSVAKINALPNASPPDPLPAIAGLFSNLIAWQHDPGAPGAPEIRARYAAGGSGLGPELALSSSAQGPTDAAGGLAGGGDVAGDAAVAWVQGTLGALQIVTVQMYQPPGAPAPTTAFQYVRSTAPRLAWRTANETWGPLRYLVGLDGKQFAQTGATAVSVPAALAQGPHSWQVTAINQAGGQSASRVATVFVDTVAPRARFAVSGHRRTGTLLHIYVTYTDSPPPLPAADASGVAKVVVTWGDGVRNVIRHGRFHSYRHPGRYRIAVLVTDRAGNTTTLVSYLRIRRPPKRAAPHSRRRG